MFATTNTSFVVRKVCLSQQNFCRDKTRLLSRQKYVCCDKHVFVATKIILVAAPANDTRYVVDGVEDCVCLHQSSLGPQNLSVGVAAWSQCCTCPSFLVLGAGLQNVLWGLCACLTWAVCVSHGQYVSHMSSMCLPEMCVSHG